MRRSITYSLLITCFLFVISCNSIYQSVSYHADNVSISDSLNSLNSEVVQLYLPYKNILEKDMNRVISVSEAEMMKNKPESSLTNFLADLLLEEGRIYTIKEGLSFEPVISYFNYGGIRTFLPEGEITVGKIFELMPFENEMVFVRLDGSQIKEFLNIIAEKGGDSVGGVRFKISNEKAKSIQIEGKALQTAENYWLVTNDYVAGGGDDLQILTKRSDFVNSNKRIRELIISYLEKKQEKGEKIIAETDGRISYE